MNKNVFEVLKVIQGFWLHLFEEDKNSIKTNENSLLRITCRREEEKLKTHHKSKDEVVKVSAQSEQKQALKQNFCQLCIFKMRVSHNYCIGWKNY